MSKELEESKTIPIPLLNFFLTLEFVQSFAYFWRGGGGSGALTRTEHPIIHTWLKVKPLENLPASLTKLTLNKTKQKYL